MVKFGIKVPADMSPFWSLRCVQLRTGVLWRGAVSLGQQLPTFQYLLTQQRTVTSHNTHSPFTQPRQIRGCNLTCLLMLSYLFGTNRQRLLQRAKEFPGYYISYIYIYIFQRHNITRYHVYIHTATSYNYQVPRVIFIQQRHIITKYNLSYSYTNVI